jgi:hypothetical protein
MIRQISDDLLWSQVVARAWCDEGFMRRLLSDPRDVLSEHGLEVPEGTEVKVVEGTEVKVEDAEAVRHFVLPVSPPDELTDEDLVGDAVAWCGACGACGCRCRC